MADEETPVSEGDRRWREQMQETNELAEELRPPHDDETERGNPAPAKPRD